MTNAHFSRHDEVLDLAEEITDDLTNVSEKVEQLRTLLTEPYSPSYSPDDFDNE